MCFETNSLLHAPAALFDALERHYQASGHRSVHSAVHAKHDPGCRAGSSRWDGGHVIAGTPRGDRTREVDAAGIVIVEGGTHGRDISGADYAEGKAPTPLRPLAPRYCVANFANSIEQEMPDKRYERER